MGAVWMGASMGPQLGSCGRPSATRPWPSAWRCFNGAATWQLRKGHARTARQDGHGASMGPQPGSCGRGGLGRPARRAQAASMGPQPGSCGRDRLITAAYVPAYLQWGLTWQLRKGGGAKAMDFTAMLQWGRNLAVAEGRASMGRRETGGTASMGPHLGSCGRCGICAISIARATASMGPHLGSCGRQF